LEHADQEMTTQCFDFSGTYDIAENEKTMMKFTSLTTEGFSGQSVIITLENKYMKVTS